MKFQLSYPQAVTIVLALMTMMILSSTSSPLSNTRRSFTERSLKGKNRAPFLPTPQQMPSVPLNVVSQGSDGKMGQYTMYGPSYVYGGQSFYVLKPPEQGGPPMITNSNSNYPPASQLYNVDNYANSNYQPGPMPMDSQYMAMSMNVPMYGPPYMPYGTYGNYPNQNPMYNHYQAPVQDTTTTTEKPKRKRIRKKKRPIHTCNCCCNDEDHENNDSEDCDSSCSCNDFEPPQRFESPADSQPSADSVNDIIAAYIKANKLVGRLQTYTSTTTTEPPKSTKSVENPVPVLQSVTYIQTVPVLNGGKNYTFNPPSSNNGVKNNAEIYSAIKTKVKNQDLKIQNSRHSMPPKEGIRMAVHEYPEITPTVLPLPITEYQNLPPIPIPDPAPVPVQVQVPNIHHEVAQEFQFPRAEFQPNFDMGVNHNEFSEMVQTLPAQPPLDIVPPPGQLPFIPEPFQPSILHEEIHSETNIPLVSEQVGEFQFQDQFADPYFGFGHDEPTADIGTSFVSHLDESQFGPYHVQENQEGLNNVQESRYHDIIEFPNPDNETYVDLQIYDPFQPPEIQDFKIEHGEDHNDNDRFSNGFQKNESIVSSKVAPKKFEQKKDDVVLKSTGAPAPVLSLSNSTKSVKYSTNSSVSVNTTTPLMKSEESVLEPYYRPLSLASNKTTYATRNVRRPNLFVNLSRNSTDTQNQNAPKPK